MLWSSLQLWTQPWQIRYKNRKLKRDVWLKRSSESFLEASDPLGSLSEVRRELSSSGQAQQVNNQGDRQEPSYLKSEAEWESWKKDIVERNHCLETTVLEQWGSRNMEWRPNSPPKTEPSHILALRLHGCPQDHYKTETPQLLLPRSGCLQTAIIWSRMTFQGLDGSCHKMLVRQVWARWGGSKWKWK